jgi:hypothetical protein
MNNIKAPRSDLRLAIERFIEALAPDAPLRGVVALAAVENLLQAFDAADAVAMEKQLSYRRAGRVALWSTMIGAVVGAIVLLPLDTWLAGWPRNVIEGVQTIALLLTFVALMWLGWRKPVDEWMAARAYAEGLRGDVFRMIIKQESDARESETVSKLLPEKLRCFTSCHLDNQIAYFARQGDNHRRSARRLTPLRMVGYLLSGIAILIGLVSAVHFAIKFGLPIPPLLAGWTQWLAFTDSSRWQLGLGAIASSLLAFASARSLMDQDERNASSYKATASLLRRIRSDDLTSAEAAAKAGHTATVTGFCEKVQAVLSAEHLAWILSPPAPVVASART